MQIVGCPIHLCHCTDAAGPGGAMPRGCLIGALNQCVMAFVLCGVDALHNVH